MVDNTKMILQFIQDPPKKKRVDLQRRFDLEERFQPFVILFKTKTYSRTFIRKCIHTTKGAASQPRYKEILRNTH